MKIKKYKFNKAFLYIALKDIKSIIFSTSGLVVGGLFIITLNILTFGIGKFGQFGTNDLTQVFGYLVFALAIAVSALVMGSISKERSVGTLELLSSKPVSDLDIILAKFLGFSLLSSILVLLTLPFSIFIASIRGLDLGQITMQYLGAIIIAACFVSVGLAISALFKSEIPSFLATIFLISLLLISGSGLFSFLPSSIGVALERISLLSHYQSISRGVLDFRDLFYFIAFILFFLAIAYYLLLKDKFPKNHKYLSNARIAVGLFSVIALIIGVLGEVIPGRIDFTTDQRFSLSSETISVLNKISDPLSIKYYVSSNLPSEFQSELRRVNDLFTDYARYSNSKITFSKIEPDKSDALKKEAESAGITPIQFSVNSADSAQVVVGYFGVEFKYLDKTEVINFNSEVLAELEFQATRAINKLTKTDKKTIAFVTNNVGLSLSSNLTTLNKDLADFFDIKSLELNKSTLPIDKNISAIIIPAPSVAFDTEVISALKDYYLNGGGILLLSEAVNTSLEQPEVNLNALSNLFSDFGVTVNPDLVYDLKQNNVIAIQSLFSPILYNFPQWIIANPIEQNNPITKDIKGVSLLWANSINLTNVEGHKSFKLLETSINSNIQKQGEFNTSLEQEWFQKDSDSKKTVAVALENNNNGRAVIVSDADFITDNILSALVQRQQQDKQCISFVLNSLSWIAKDSLIGGIKSKSASASLLSLSSSEQLNLVLISVIIPVVLVSAPFAISYFNRKKLAKRKYNS